MRDAIEQKPLRLVHIGDLHLTHEEEKNHRDLSAIVEQLNAHTTDAIDFVFLPGDIAEHGEVGQFGLAFEQMARLRALWRAIPGDHDFETKSLDNFYSMLDCRWLPLAHEVHGCVCFFLDVVSAGTGGPDFRLGADQVKWLRDQLNGVRDAGKTAAIFMHCYPSDLGEEATEVAALIDDSPVVLVDMGHTHYNELANDGRTIYAATRSVGQIEEGEVGFAFIVIDRGVVSWRFKTLSSSWPFVMITCPADHRLAISSSTKSERCAVKASVWGADPIAEAAVRIDEGLWQAMIYEASGLLHAEIRMPAGRFRLSVRVVDDNGAEDTDTIEIDPSGFHTRTSSGSDAGRIGAWRERHLFGTQLGPNRNGRKW